MESNGGWKANRGGQGEPNNNSYFGQGDAAGHLRKRSFSQAFVPPSQEGQMSPCSYNNGGGGGGGAGTGIGRGLLPTPRWTGAGGYGMQEMPRNVDARNEMGRTYNGRMGHNGQTFHHLDPTQNQYINRMLVRPSQRGKETGFQGIHGAVPLVRVPPVAGSSNYTNAPVAFIHPWHQQQQEQHQGEFWGHCRGNNEFPYRGHNPMPSTSLDSNNNSNEANETIYMAQEANVPMNYANIFAKSLNYVVNHQQPHQVPHPTSPELPPPVVPLEIPPPTLDSSSVLPPPSSRPYVGFTMSLPSDNQNLSKEQSQSEKQEMVKPKHLEVKKSTLASSAVLIGKRPGGKHLPTGVIKRPGPVPSSGNQPNDAKNGPASPKEAWSRYMAEVERYRNQSCSEETPNRPLVK